MITKASRNFRSRNIRWLLMKHFYVFNIDQTDFKENIRSGMGTWGQILRSCRSGQRKGNGNPWLDKMIKEQKWLYPIELKVQDRAYCTARPKTGSFFRLRDNSRTWNHSRWPPFTKWPTPPGIPHDWTRAASPVRNVRICPGGNHRRIHSCRHRQGPGNSRNSERRTHSIWKAGCQIWRRTRLCHECVTGGRQGIRHDRGKCEKQHTPGRHIRQGRGHIPTPIKRRRKQWNGLFRHSRYVWPLERTISGCNGPHPCGDEYKAYNQDAERLHEVLGVCARKAVSEKTARRSWQSFRHVDLDTHPVV